MTQKTDAERLITGLLAQLSQDQQRMFALDELDERFDAVMKALDKYHQAGQARSLPILLADPATGYIQVAAALHYGIAAGYTRVEHGHFRLVMTADKMYDLLRCFDADELKVLRWLSGVFATPSMADHDVV